MALRGDYTLIATYNFLQSPGNSVLKRLLNATGATKVVEFEYQEKVNEALLEQQRVSKPIGIVQPASLSSLSSVLIASSYFVLGPFPPDMEKGFFGYLISFESPLWWILCLFVLITVRRNFSMSNFMDSSCQLHFILLIGMILMSALVEVNLGTSFRHKSILIVPLLVLVFSTVKKDSFKESQIRK